MNRLSTYHLLIILFIQFFIYSCSGVRESAGVNRKSPDEFKVIENPPIIIPPDYNLVSPDQLKEKEIDTIEKDLAEEILFGLGENKSSEIGQLSTMNEILTEANALNANENIREEIDEDFINEINIENNSLLEWEDEKEVLDAIKESERIRENNFDNESIIKGSIPIKKEKIKKKKKRFIFF